MKPELILLRFGEFTLKGKNRLRFEQAVIHYTLDVLRDYPGLRYRKAYGRLYLELNGAPYENVAERLKSVFGIQTFSPVLFCGHDLEVIRAAALSVMDGLSRKPKTFKVTVKRTWKEYPYDSQELNGLIGGPVLRHVEGLTVDVHKPEVELRVEIREDGAYLFSDVIKGAGGYPVGSNGKAMLMLSGGIDSPVAGWLAMRKGLDIEAVHFHSYPFTSERAQQKVKDLALQLAKYTRKVKVHMVPFTEIQTRLNQLGQPNLLITLMRRAMFRITEQLAAKHEAGAVVTGESLGQVASQTLPSLNTIGKVAELPILRPLITMDKDDIIRIAHRIGTYETSILPYEDCCTLFAAKSPSTNPNLRVIERIERSASSWLEEEIRLAVEGTETFWFSQLFDTSVMDQHAGGALPTSPEHQETTTAEPQSIDRFF
ncbi:tRNA uracil 4-sulfurtransferase ThiI [Paenibacillus gansuensis]|uniref:Probable tRNA sulfurtransferase n=1 Tax=Paenibacillus gansuensis TaxID=306542 RepID=A0ABW5PCS2_9BACL